MSSHPGLPTGPPHVLVVVDDQHVPEATCLLAALDVAPRPTVGAWLRDPDAPALATLHNAAELVDVIRDWAGQRPAYRELVGPLDAAVVAWASDIDPGHDGHDGLVVVGTHVGARQVRRIRRALRDTRLHLGVAPPRATPHHGLVPS